MENKLPTANYPSLKGRVVIITGGGQALGRTYAHEFAAQGAIPVSYTHLTLPTIYSV